MFINERFASCASVFGYLSKPIRKEHGIEIIDFFRRTSRPNSSTPRCARTTTRCATCGASEFYLFISWLRYATSIIYRTPLLFRNPTETYTISPDGTHFPFSRAYLWCNGWWKILQYTKFDRFRYGECVKNPGYMYKYCRQSCGICSIRRKSWWSTEISIEQTLSRFHALSRLYSNLECTLQYYYSTTCNL